MIETACVAALLPAVRRLALARGCAPRAAAGHPVAVALVASWALAAVALYPLPRHLAWLGLVWALAAAAVDAPSRAGTDAKGRSRSRALERSFRAAALFVGALVVALFADLLLRATGRFATWSERNGGAYAAPSALRTTRPFLLTRPERSVSVDRRAEFTFACETNAEGVRDVEHAPAKPAGVYRIVTLGDSFTEGMGAELADSWPKALERRLNAVPRGARVEVVMGGVAGSDPVLCAQLLERRLLKYAPDLVLLAVNDSDVLDVISRGGRDRFTPDGEARPRAEPWFEPLYARSHLARFLVHESLGYSFLLLSADDVRARTGPACEEIAAVADDLRALGRTARFELVVILHPLLQHVRDRTPDDLESLRLLLRARRVPVVDLVPTVRAAVQPERALDYYWPVDQHCNARGYDLFASAIEADLEALTPSLPRRAR